MKAKPLTSLSIRRPRRTRKYRMDLSGFACPNPRCAAHGQRGAGNLRIKDRYGKTEPRFRLVCRVCRKSFSERRGTVLFHAKKSTPDITRLCRALVDGNGVRGAARVCEIDKDTVGRYLRRLGPHAAAVNNAHCRDLQATELQVDEAWTYVTKKQHNLTHADRRDRPEWGDAWLYLATDAATKLIPAAMIGDRTQPDTSRFIDDLAGRFASPFPLVTSDKLENYREALRPLLVDHPYLQYVQIKGGHGSDVDVIYGRREVVNAVMAASPVSNVPNTSAVEAMFGNVRLGNRRMQRKLNGVSKKREMLWHQIALYCAWYNFCKPHKSLRRALPNPNGKRWEPRTPAMAAGLVERPWTMADLLTAGA